MNMKKNFKVIICALLALSTLQSCATVFGGPVNAYQRTKPLPGQETRKLRVGAFIADILLFWPGAIIDFATCAIYKPHASDTAPAPATPPAPTTTTTSSN
jgi:hypothetical protein